MTRQARTSRIRPAFVGLGLALLLVVLSLNLNPCSANDLFWQLRAGREILTTHLPPTHDAYSWTRPGAPWIVHEWLAFAALWAAYAGSGGFAGVWLLQAALVCATFALLFARLWRETEGAPLTSFLLAVGAALVASAFFQPRPHLFSYLFLTLTVGLALAVRRQETDTRRLWGLVPLFALWANLHAGVLVGVVILALFALGDALEGGLLTPRGDPARQSLLRQAGRLGLVAAACGAATLATPYGPQLYHNFGATLSNSTAMNSVIEWFSPNFHEPYGKCLEALMAVCVFGLLFSRQKRDVATLLILAAFVHAGLTAYRNVPLFALVGVLVTARHVQSALTACLARCAGGDSASPSLFGTAPPARILGAVAAVFLLLMAARAAKILQKATEAASNPLERIARVTIALDAFPEKACRFLEAMRFPTTLRLYNEYDYGGYLIWRVPQYPVFMDGRADIYFGRVLEDYVKVHKLAYNWRDILARYQPDMALLSAETVEARLFLASPEWALVYSDDPNLDAKKRLNMLIFVRNLPQHAALITRCRRERLMVGRL